MAIGETISHQFWSGLGTGSFDTAAIALTDMATQLSSIMDGQQANAGALLTAWASPTGEKAIAANSPYGTWLTEAAASSPTRPPKSKRQRGPSRRRRQ